MMVRAMVIRGRGLLCLLIVFNAHTQRLTNPNGDSTDRVGGARCENRATCTCTDSRDSRYRANGDKDGA